MNEYIKKLQELGVINTELTPGCRLKFRERGIVIMETFAQGDDVDYLCREYGNGIKGKYVNFRVFDGIEILGHPLYIGGVLHYIKKILSGIVGKKIKILERKEFNDNMLKLISIWQKDLSLPFHLLPNERQKAVCDVIEGL